MTKNAPIRLLLIEDNPGDVRLIQEYLTPKGSTEIELLSKSRLSEALEHLKSHEVDIALMDLGLPDSVGLETLHTFRQAAPAIPVVVLTGLDDEEIAKEALRAGAQDYVTKGNHLDSMLPRAIRYAMERQQRESALMSNERALLQAQRLESLGVLAGGIAHDFNNLLTILMGNLELAKLRISEVSPALPHLKNIENVALRAADLSRQMLAYSGKGRFLIRDLSLNEILSEMLHLIEVTIPKTIRLNQTLLPDLPLVEGDVAQIQQVILNLVTNAVDAIGDKPGEIHIHTMRREMAAEDFTQLNLNLPVPEAGIYSCLLVTDTGCGMGAETLSKIFDPFFSTKAAGRGLGLSAMQGIVRSHRGAIKVYSELDRGTTFLVLLPASEEKMASSESPARSRSFAPGGKILVVDDEEEIRDSLTAMLQSIGFDVLVAEDGEEGLEQYRLHQKEIRVVLSDLSMPKMDGEMFFGKVREINPKVRVILSSGYNHASVIRRFLNMGLAGFLQKPYRLKDLVLAVQDALSDPERQD
jgi:two-component system, cell cycle sensor histidine kinase and response regulator CckA